MIHLRLMRQCHSRVVGVRKIGVRRDGCDGPLIATVPLAAATRTSGVADVSGPITAQQGAHDLCMTFTGRGPDPYWVLDRLTLQ